MEYLVDIAEELLIGARLKQLQTSRLCQLRDAAHPVNDAITAGLYLLRGAVILCK